MPPGAFIIAGLLLAARNAALTDGAAHMNATKRLQIFERLRDVTPAPTTELRYESVFELLIAVILSAQATDVSVNVATRKLYPVANTPAALLALGVEGLTPFIRHIGLYNAKARNIIATCEILLERYQGQVPNDRAALESLPGVGRKTANVVLNTAFGEPTIAVDTHVFRVANRTRIARGKTVRRGRRPTAQSRARAIQERRASPADSPRPLCVHRARPALRRLCDRRSLRISAQGRMTPAC